MDYGCVGYDAVLGGYWRCGETPAGDTFLQPAKLKFHYLKVTNVCYF
jgi:hypothetical protein